MNRVSEPVPGLPDGLPCRIEWDVAGGHAAIHLADGRSAGMPVNLLATAEGVGIARMVYSFADHTLTLTTPGGERVTAEIELPSGTVQHAGRLVVYLDQGHWGTLVRHIYDPDSIAHQDGIAAEKLIEWARGRRIILPLSSGHMIETTPLYGVKRQQLALVMLELSRGWHMRNPLRVRYDWIAHVLGNASPEMAGYGRDEVFTLNPDSLYETTAATPLLATAELPEYLEWLCARLAAVTANFDLLMDPQRIPPEKATGWCNQLAAAGRNA